MYDKTVPKIYTVILSEAKNLFLSFQNKKINKEILRPYGLRMTRKGKFTKILEHPLCMIDYLVLDNLCRETVCKNQRCHSAAGKKSWPQRCHSEQSEESTFYHFLKEEIHRPTASGWHREVSLRDFGTLFSCQLTNKIILSWRLWINFWLLYWGCKLKNLLLIKIR
jgi:hypothetical protein